MSLMKKVSIEVPDEPVDDQVVSLNTALAVLAAHGSDIPIFVSDADIYQSMIVLTGVRQRLQAALIVKKERDLQKEQIEQAPKPSFSIPVDTPPDEVEGSSDE